MNTCPGQPTTTVAAAAMIPLVFLLSPLHLPLLHPTLVDVESGEGQHDEAEDESDQDHQHQRGRERLEELLSHLRDAGATTCAWAADTCVAASTSVVGSKGPIEETRRQCQPQLFRRPGTHRRWAERGQTHQASSVVHTVPTSQDEDKSPRHPNCSLALEGLRERLPAGKLARASGPREIVSGPP